MKSNKLKKFFNTKKGSFLRIVGFLEKKILNLMKKQNL